jgi:hypothetical protein
MKLRHVIAFRWLVGTGPGRHATLLDRAVMLAAVRAAIPGLISSRAPSSRGIGIRLGALFPPAQPHRLQGFLARRLYTTMPELKQGEFVGSLDCGTTYGQSAAPA